MAPRQLCGHERARFQGVQRLGRLQPVELWHCPACKSTISGQRSATSGQRGGLSHTGAGG